MTHRNLAPVCAVSIPTALYTYKNIKKIWAGVTNWNSAGKFLGSFGMAENGGRPTISNWNRMKNNKYLDVFVFKTETAGVETIDACHAIVIARAG